MKTNKIFTLALALSVIVGASIISSSASAECPAVAAARAKYLAAGYKETSPGVFSKSSSSSYRSPVSSNSGATRSSYSRSYTRPVASSSANRYSGAYRTTGGTASSYSMSEFRRR